MGKLIRIGTRESRLAVWQATHVQQLLAAYGYASELVYIKSEGDQDLITPLYEIGVEGIFTKTLDTALINNRIDIAVHSMKDVPIQLAQGIAQGAVLKRGSYKDILVYKPGSLNSSDWALLKNKPDEFERLLAQHQMIFTVATCSLRRKAQWLHHFPQHHIDSIRGNVDTRIHKLNESNWQGAIFAAAGLERIDLRPGNSIDLDWMLPAPAQGAIMVVCREDDEFSMKACSHLNDTSTATCTKVERDFLKCLHGGCTTPISALAVVQDELLVFKGNILSLDGSEQVTIEQTIPVKEANEFGITAAESLVASGGQKIADSIRHAK